MVSRRHKLFWGSSYDRGLDVLLFMWPDIKKEYPEAELHICYGWNLFDIANRTNPERMEWKKSVQRMMQADGIVHHGRVSQPELKKIREQCGIWAYPTYFTEINCITALECQSDGVVPVTMDLAALEETVGSGVKVKGKITEMEVQEKYQKELISMMGDEQRWNKESKKGKKFAKKYHWDKLATKWIDYFEKPVSTPKVSVITVTIREGFWNIMAHNLSNQTYPIHEWVIVDDHKEDRSDIAKKYAKEYNLNIKYIRGDKALGKYKRKVGLVRANNIGWKQAEGDLLVWLQDFIIIPNNGVESIVDVHRHHPRALIAPVDIYYHCKKPNMANKEDWWGGQTKILAEESWRNVRVQFGALRTTDNPFDFEMNYSAMPRELIEKLNGWWEFFDEGLGFDNTEIADRALEMGYEIIIDDTNIAKCIDLWPHIGGTEQNVSGRDRMLTVPQWVWFKDQKFNPVRDEKIDNKIKHTFEVPDEIPDEQASQWIRKNARKIIEKWK